MPTLSLDRLRDYRSRTFRTSPHLRLKNIEQAVGYVEERGFIAFWPIKGVLLPSLWVATAGDRPIPDEHDDPGHVTWGWKDELLGKRRWYYARILFHRNTLISLDALPFFYALSENYGDYTEDHILLYEQGRLTLEAKSVYEALLREGPLDTIALRQAARLSGHASNARFTKALDDLQRDFKVLPVGVAEAGAWHYAFIYDLTGHHYPELPNRSRPITERQARHKLLELYFSSLGAASLRDCSRCFGWPTPTIAGLLTDMQSENRLCSGLNVPGLPGELFALPDLCILDA
ncbi:MAG: crosslink repair DNA glycosylase YcaQ family protein [Anaerolineaceae bacterium]|nr:crosslink repair DNA glycosylase YcaQ family protein [Anaerolineaceae bacterium]